VFDVRDAFQERIPGVKRDPVGIYMRSRTDIFNQFPLGFLHYKIPPFTIL